jgi:hypothetical protein
MKQYDVEIIRYIFDPTAQQMPDIGNAAFIDVVRRHRVLGPAVAKLATLPGFANGELELSLRREHAISAQIFFNSLNIIKEFAGILSQETGVLMLKGNTSFLHTNDLSNLRQSFDCDLLVEDPDAYEQAIGSVVGVEFRPTNDLDLHEVGGLVYKGVEFDVQRSAQVITRSHSPRQLRRPKSLDQSQFRQISYSDLADECLLSCLGNCRICAPAQAAVMSITHTYRDYVKYSSMNSRRKSPIRAGDLWDIACFVRHPAFRPQAFLSLVEKYDIVEQCYFISDLLTEYLHAPDLQQLLIKALPAPSADDCVYLADRLLFNSYWHTFGGHALVPNSSSDELVLPNVNFVALPRDGASIRLTDENLDFISTSDDPQNAVSFSLEMSRQIDTLQLKISPEWSGKPNGKRVHVDFVGTILEWNQRSATPSYFASNGKLIKKDILLSWALREDGSHDIALRLPKSDEAKKQVIIVAIGEFNDIPRLNNITATALIEFH